MREANIFRSEAEAELLRRISDGDQQAFAEFYHNYYKLLRPFIWKHLPTQEDAEEVMQQVFIRAWLHRDELPGIENMAGWLFKIASREYLAHIRNRIHRRLKAGSLETAENSPLMAIEEARAPMSLKEVNSLIIKALETLSPQRKLVFQYSRLEHLSIEEIAGRMDISPKTVKNTLTAALAQVREYLSSAGYAISILVLLRILSP